MFTIMENEQAFIGLIDCNNFFVSCERLFDPRLMNRPVGVLSSNDGCFVARSNELKALGVSMGAPYFKVKDIIDKHKVIVRSANFSLYDDISKRVMRILKNDFPSVEVYSIDEAFIYFNKNSAKEIYEEGKAIKEKLDRWVGIPVSVGIARTKTLAKVACDIAKKNKMLEGVYILESKEQVEEILKNFKVGDIWGIGRQKAKFLNSKGIEIAYDFLNLSDSWVKKNLSITGLRTLFELRGVPCLAFKEMAENNKSILRSRSFGKPITTLEDLSEAVAHHASNAAEMLRSQNSVTSSLGVFIKTNRFSAEPYYSQSAIEYFVEATDYTPDFLHAARTALGKIFKSGYRYHKAGVFCSHVFPKPGAQLDLFKHPENLPKKNKQMAILDAITAKYGSKGLFYGANGIKNNWHSKQEHSSEHTINHDEVERLK